MDRAVRVDDAVYHLRWGSAEVVVGLSQNALAVSAPMFKELPSGKEALFCLRLLQLNDTMGGVASFAIQADGWVVLQAGRSAKGMDLHEFKVVVRSVGKFADLYDDQLFDEFYDSQLSGQHRLPTDDYLPEGEEALGTAPAVPVDSALTEGSREGGSEPPKSDA
ncbi:hypothetical protein Hoch_6329 [Haliangium ochraceum DSM 14365]|uniref:Tir chaperone family protein n=2 Tax=Haliangium ochraceum TaxID=80816 RepID=D0LNX3_HALO1|nr:hypothetical protein Hoch_6329 [Haliangium ochraceum DSM 14365]